jgi:hypothetical protein
MLPDYVAVQNISNATSVGTWFSNGSILNISLGWVPSAVLNSGAFAGAVNVSFAADPFNQFFGSANPNEYPSG